MHFQGEFWATKMSCSLSKRDWLKAHVFQQYFGRFWRLIGETGFWINEFIAFYDPADVPIVAFSPSLS